MSQTVWLVRHPPVALAWQKRCYGQSDPGLGREGARQAKEIAARLAVLSPDLVIHSDLKRTRSLAELTRLPLMAEARWRERHFGSWEGKSWQRIYRETGNAMDGMLTAPDQFRPGGGETTAELFERIKRAWLALPPLPRIAIITHGGPAACVRALLEGAPAVRLPELTPSTGQILLVARTPSTQCIGPLIAADQVPTASPSA